MEEACGHSLPFLSLQARPFCGIHSASGRQGLKYERCRTLSYYLKRRDCLQALAQDLAVPEKAVVATVMKQIFECLTVSTFLGSGRSQILSALHNVLRGALL